MSNGLLISEEEFLSLPSKKQNLVLYQNQVKTMNLIKGYKFHQKVLYIMLTILLTGVGILFKIHLPNI